MKTINASQNRVIVVIHENQELDESRVVGMFTELANAKFCERKYIDRFFNEEKNDIEDTYLNNHIFHCYEIPLDKINEPLSDEDEKCFIPWDEIIDDYSSARIEFEWNENIK